MRFWPLKKISLAVKVGLLFAVAVLLIVSAALFVPWDRMQRLAKEQDLAEARQFATMRLLEHCAAPAGLRPAAATAADTQSDRPGPVANLWAQLRPDETGWPHTEFYTPVPRRDDKTVPRFVRRAMENFHSYPQAGQFYQYSFRKPPGGDQEQYVLEYVRALRITDNCAKCHVSPTAAKPFAANELVGVVYVQMPTTEPLLFGRISLNLAVVVGAGIIAVIMAVVVFYIIMKSVILHPVRQLRRLADHIGEGDLAVRSTISTGDEFERLAKAFNSMLERLQVSQQQLRKINESLNSKMDELARANVALFESNRLKSEFLARVSHELRTPLNSIIGFAEVLGDHMTELAERGPCPVASTADGTEVPCRHAPAAPQKVVRYAENILTSGRMLLELINDLLDLAKIEAGKMSVHYEKVVVRDLVEAVVNFMRPTADKKNLQVTVSIDAGLPLIETDGGKVQQILYNLFSNAVKFTQPRGSVAVRAIGQGEELALSVADTGPGIPPEDQQSIFEKFHQLDSTVTREHGGTGLGLSISQELAEMLGGRISLVSRLGEGSTFTLRLPLKPPADKATRPASETADV